jgi:hypothetical protein
MITVIIHDEVDGPGPQAGRGHGKWFWVAWQDMPDNVVRCLAQGFSRQPLLDACRAVKLTGEAALSEEIASRRSGSKTWDLRTTVGYGATRTVREDNKIGPKFAKWQPMPPRDRLT